jgi:DNA-binding PadR family transcriptional regulator
MRNNRRSKGKGPPFVSLEYRVINSDAFIEMRHSSRDLLPYFLAKARYRHNDYDIYEKVFEFTYKEAKRYRFSSSTYYAAVEQLRKQGFIDKVKQGGSHGEYKASNLYRLSQRWQKFGTDHFVESDQFWLNEYTQKRVRTG